MLANAQYPIAQGMIIVILYYIIAGLILPLVFTRILGLSSEWMRKGHHMAHTTTPILYLYIYDSWQMAIATILILTVLFYVALSFLERYRFFTDNIAERRDGEFKRSLLVGDLSVALLIFIFWGVLGEDWQFVTVVGALVWGFGDAAAALVGKSIGRHKIDHQWVDRSKTVEGTSAMAIVSAIVIFGTLTFYVGMPWYQGLVVAIVVAPLSAIVELVSKKGSDTFTLPIASGLMTFGMISMIAV